MNNYIVTGFDEKFWPKWGSSWVLSLKKINPKSKVLVVDCGLSENTKKKIEENNFTVIPLTEFSFSSYRLNTCFTAFNFMKDPKDKFVYWDADAIFQDDIDQVFDYIEDNFILTENQNPGFLGGSFNGYKILKNINNLLSNKNQISFDSMVESLYCDFKELTVILDNSWNHTDISNVSLNEDLKIKINNKLPKVIHFSGDVKQSLEGKNIFFHERYKEEYSSFLNNKSLNPRPIFKK